VDRAKEKQRFYQGKAGKALKHNQNIRKEKTKRNQKAEGLVFTAGHSVTFLS